MDPVVFAGFMVLGFLSSTFGWGDEDDLPEYEFSSAIDACEGIWSEVLSILLGPSSDDVAAPKLRGLAAGARKWDVALAAALEGAGHLRDNPASGLARPRRRRSARRALSSDELAALFAAVLATSRDPELDLLIVSFARETACRREGILNLRLADVQPIPSVMLYEKFEEQREIPISAQLEEALRAHTEARPSHGVDTVFRYRDGQPLTDRRFDTIFRRLGDHLPWAKSLGVSLHWIRYSTLTDIRMSSGERVASAYAGHSDQSGGITGLYTRATFEELRVAHRNLFG